MTAQPITPHLKHVHAPDALRDLPGWVVWRYEAQADPKAKPRKVPYYPAGGRRHGVQGSPEDRRQLTTFDAAIATAARRGFDGVGLCLLPDWGLVALDFDNCVGAGGVHPEVLDIVGDTYAEFSPSGTGVRAFFSGPSLGNGKDPHGQPFGLEVFSSKGFVTFTGNVLPSVEVLGNENRVAAWPSSVEQTVRLRLKRQLQEQAAYEGSEQPIVGVPRSLILEALDVLPQDLDYDEWVKVGMAVHHETQGEGFDLWDTWSQRSPKYTNSDYGRERWNSFGKGGGQVVTFRSLAHLANENGAHIMLNGPASAEDFDRAAEESADFVPAPDAVSEKPKRFAVERIDQFLGRPSPTWIVKGVLPKAELAVLYGESTAGKSFMALDIALAVARGVAWRGLRVRQGRVVYIAAEGAGGFRDRVAAYCKHHEVSDVPFGVIAAAPNLMLKEDALDVVRSIGRCDLVVVDTWAQVTPGANENAGEDMGKALSHCKGIHRATGALVLLIHHSGKDVAKGARGWSGLRAACDAELEVSRLAQGRLLRSTKVKDGKDDQQWGFDLDVVTLGQDADGDAITSCVCVEKAITDASRPMRVLGATEQIVNAVVQEMMTSQTTGIEAHFVVAEAVRRMPEAEDGKRDTRKMRAQRALNGLCEGEAALYWLEDGCLSSL